MRELKEFEKRENERRDIAARQIQQYYKKYKWVFFVVLLWFDFDLFVICEQKEWGWKRFLSGVLRQRARKKTRRRARRRSDEWRMYHLKFSFFFFFGLRIQSYKRVNNWIEWVRIFLRNFFVMSCKWNCWKCCKITRDTKRERSKSKRNKKGDWDPGKGKRLWVWSRSLDCDSIVPTLHRHNSEKCAKYSPKKNAAISNCHSFCSSLMWDKSWLISMFTHCNFSPSVDKTQTWDYLHNSAGFPFPPFLFFSFSFCWICSILFTWFFLGGVFRISLIFVFSCFIETGASKYKLDWFVFAKQIA